MEKATFEIIKFDRNDFLTASSDGFVDGGAGGQGGSSGSGSATDDGFLTSVDIHQ